MNPQADSQITTGRIQQPDDLFPLELTDFEYYAFRDDTVENPMVMILRIHLEGAVDPEAFRTALQTALEHHPLLRSVIARTKGRHQWQPRSSDPLPLVCSHHAGAHPPMACRPPSIDLTTEPGARFELRVCSDRSILIAYLHHACVDGIGGIGFLADALAVYGRQTATSDEHRPIVQWPAPDVLATRGYVPPLGGQGKHWTEWLRGPARFLLGRNYCLRASTAAERRSGAPREGNARKAVPDDVLHTAVLPRATAVQLKRLAATHQVTTNDLCMLAYLQQLAAWSQSDPGRRDDDLFRILMPVSMRTPEHDDISAANVLSYVFQPVRRRDCPDAASLLASIHSRSNEMIHSNEGAVMLRLFSLVRRVPGLFWLSNTLQPSCATAVLANVGDLKRVFGRRFALDRGRIVAGNVVIQRIDGIAPLRKNTNVVISFGGYGGEFILNLRASPEVMTTDEAASFLNQMVERLATQAETQSLTEPRHATCSCQPTSEASRHLPGLSTAHSLSTAGRA